MGAGAIGPIRHGAEKLGEEAIKHPEKAAEVVKVVGQIIGMEKTEEERTTSKSSLPPLILKPGPVSRVTPSWEQPSYERAEESDSDYENVASEPVRFRTSDSETPSEPAKNTAWIRDLLRGDGKQGRKEAARAEKEKEFQDYRQVFRSGKTEAVLQYLKHPERRALSQAPDKLLGAHRRGFHTAPARMQSDQPAQMTEMRRLEKQVADYHSKGADAVAKAESWKAVSQEMQSAQTHADSAKQAQMQARETLNLAHQKVEQADRALIRAQEEMELPKDAFNVSRALEELEKCETALKHALKDQKAAQQEESRATRQANTAQEALNEVTDRAEQTRSAAQSSSEEALQAHQELRQGHAEAQSALSQAKNTLKDLQTQEKTLKKVLKQDEKAVGLAEKTIEEAQAGLQAAKKNAATIKQQTKDAAVALTHAQTKQKQAQAALNEAHRVQEAAEAKRGELYTLMLQGVQQVQDGTPLHVRIQAAQEDHGQASKDVQTAIKKVHHASKEVEECMATFEEFVQKKDAETREQKQAAKSHLQQAETALEDSQNQVKEAKLKLKQMQDDIVNADVKSVEATEKARLFETGMARFPDGQKYEKEQRYEQYRNIGLEAFCYVIGIVLKDTLKDKALGNNLRAADVLQKIDDCAKMFNNFHAYAESKKMGMRADLATLTSHVHEMELFIANADKSCQELITQIQSLDKTQDPALLGKLHTIFGKGASQEEMVRAARAQSEQLKASATQTLNELNTRRDILTKNITEIKKFEQLFKSVVSDLASYKKNRSNEKEVLRRAKIFADFAVGLLAAKARISPAKSVWIPAPGDILQVAVDFSGSKFGSDLSTKDLQIVNDMIRRYTEAQQGGPVSYDQAFEEQLQLYTNVGQFLATGHAVQTPIFHAFTGLSASTFKTYQLPRKLDLAVKASEALVPGNALVQGAIVGLTAGGAVLLKDMLEISMAQKPQNALKQASALMIKKIQDDMHVLEAHVDKLVAATGKKTPQAEGGKEPMEALRLHHKSVSKMTTQRDDMHIVRRKIGSKEDARLGEVTQPVITSDISEYQLLIQQHKQLVIKIEKFIQIHRDSTEVGMQERVMLLMKNQEHLKERLALLTNTKLADMVERSSSNKKIAQLVNMTLSEFRDCFESLELMVEMIMNPKLFK